MAQSLFRSIRMKLLGEGKLLRYLTYAIGEILLIIIGIMLALQLNNWNEDRKTQAEFEQYLVQLKVDVKKAITFNQEVADYLLDRAQSSYELVVFLEGTNRSEEALKDFELNLNRLGQYRSIQLNAGLLGELFDGKTEVISRDPLLYERTLDVISTLMGRKEVTEHILRNIDAFRSQLSSFYGGQHRLIPEMEITYDLNKLERSDQFKYLIQSIARRQSTAHTSANGIVRNLTEFLTLLEEYEI